MAAHRPDRRIVITADTWFGATTHGIAQGFRRLGWDVQEVAPTRFVPAYRSNPGRAIRRLVMPLAEREYRDALMRLVKASQPDAFLTIKGLHLTPELVDAISAQGIVTANYYPDFHFGYHGLSESVFAHYDCVFTTKSFQVDYLRTVLGAKRAEYLPHGYNEEAHQPFRPDRNAEQREAACQVDVGYVGSHNAYKEPWLVAFRRACPEVSFRIYGGGWDRPGVDTALRDAVASTPVMGKAYARALAEARINIAIHSGPFGPQGWEDLTSSRTFEIPACKALMLHVDNAEVRGLFDPENEVPLFDSVDALVDQVRILLPDAERRQAMIDAAYARCVPDYSLDARAKVMAGWFEQATA